MAVVRSQAQADYGTLVTTLMTYTLADYTAGGTAQPAEGDIVTFSTTGDWYVKIAPDNTTKYLGRVRKLSSQASGSGTGQVVVEWLDVERFVLVDCDDMTTMTLGNSAIKDGNTTVTNNFDAGATTGALVVVAKSGTAAAAGTAVCGVSWAS